MTRVRLLLVLAFLLVSSIHTLVYGQSSDATPPANPSNLTVRDSCESKPIYYLPLNWDPIDPSKTKGWITPKKQEGKYWCWAATAQMAVNFHGGIQTASLKGTSLEQCREVDDIFYSGVSTCCSGSSTCERDSINLTSLSVPQFGRYGFYVDSGLAGTPALIDSWSELKRTICHKRSPFLYFFIYADNIEHINLVFGYDVTAKHVFSVDPLDPVIGPMVRDGNPSAALDFDTYFQSGDSLLEHTRDYYDICPAASRITDSNGNVTCPIIQ